MIAQAVTGNSSMLPANPTHRCRGTTIASHAALVLLVLPALLLQSAFAEPGARHQPGESLLIRTRAGDEHELRVYLAVTNEQRARGLMFVKSLPIDAGMLFVYQQPRMISMWMKNTYIPLDMLFIDQAGRIVHIQENTTPHSRENISSRQPARAVLEINGGLAHRLGIAVGDLVIHSTLASDAASQSSETD